MMLQVAGNATGGRAPEAVVAAATSATTASDAVTNAKAIAQYADATQTAKQLTLQNSTNQSQAWAQMSPQAQEQLTAAGYKPPDDTSGSWWRTALGDAGKVLNWHPIHDVLNVLGSGLRASQHVARTFMVMHNELNAETMGNANQPVGFDSQGLSTIFSPKDWANAWDETNNGQKYIEPTVTRAVFAKYGAQTYQLAYKLATGQSEAEIIAAAPAAQQTHLANEFQTNKDLAAAANELNAGHLSIGRQIVGPHFLTAHPLPASIISGAIDGLFDWFGDPFVIGGKLAGAAAESRYLVTNGDDVLNLYDRLPSVRAAAANVAEHVRTVKEGTGSMQAAMDAWPSLSKSGLLQTMVKENAVTGEAVRDVMADTANTKALISGDPVRASFFNEAGGSLPHLTPLGQLRLAAKGALTKTIDFAADRPIRVEDVEDRDVAPGPLQNMMSRVPGAARIEMGVGRFTRRALRLTPSSHIFNANGPDALWNLRDALSGFMDSRAVDQVLRTYAMDPDLGARWKLYRSTMLTLADAAGLRENPDAWDSIVGKITATSDRLYAPKLMDLMTVDGQKLHVGILKSDMNEGWLLPDFREMYVAARKVGLTQTLVRGVNASFIDTFMGFWRPFTLARLGFATRVAGEEAFGFMLREGPLTYLRALGANLYAKGAMRAATVDQAEATGDALGELPAAQGLVEITKADHANLYNGLKSGVPPVYLPRTRNIAHLIAEQIATRTRNAMEHTGSALAGDAYREAIDRWIEHGGMDESGSLPKVVTAMHGWDPQGGLDDVHTMAQIKDRTTGKLVAAEMVGTGAYRGYRSGENLFTTMYQRQLRALASDDWSREALLVRRPRVDRVNAIVDKLMDDPDWKLSMRSVQDRAGRLAANGETNARQLAEDHANVIVDLAEKMLRSPRTGKYVTLHAADGNERTLADYLLRNADAPPVYAARDAQDPGQLSSIADEDMPLEVKGPEMVPAWGTKYDPRRLSDWMFRKVIGPQINWISRQPMFFHAYAESRDAYQGMADLWRSQGWSEDNIEDMLHQNATTRAISQVVPFVHNPELRSQMSQVTRNIAPFWFAQEQFYKRWARTFTYSPWAFRQAQLISSGIQHVGFVHTDPTNGQEYFVYPGSAQLLDLVTGVMGVFGIKVQIPVQADLTGYVSMLNPGLERLGLPNVGPMAVIPMDGIKALFPATTSAINDVEGVSAENSSYFTSIMPADLLRVVDAVWPGTFAKSEFASATMSAIAYLETTGHGLAYPALRQIGMNTTGDFSAPKGTFTPGDYYNANGTYYVYQPGGTWQNNSPQVMQTYLTRVENWAKVFMALRAVWGFSAPASPENYFDPKGEAAQLTTLMNELPYDQAVAEFMREHPDATALTLGQTQSQVEGYLPATETAMAFLSANNELVSKHPWASTYFIPQVDTSGTFDMSAYQQQLTEGLRLQKAPADYWTEIAYQQAANIYFNAEDYKDSLIAKGTMSTTDVDEQWTQYSENFMAANPLFAQQYSDQGETTREEIMKQVGDALSDGSAPPSPQTEAVRNLYNAWVYWRSLTANYGQPDAPTSSSAEVRAVDQQFATWVGGYVQQFPGVLPLVQRVIQPELSSTLTDMAAAGIAPASLVSA